MRRRSAEVRAEAAVWHVWASARLDGARLPIETVRAAAVGAVSLPDDPVGRVVAGALRASAEADRLADDGGRRLTTAPAQAFAGMHLAAAHGLVDDSALGRPRPEALARLQSLAGLISSRTPAPALVIAALAHAELLTQEPFESSGAVMARALSRAIVVGRGLDPMGAAVPEWVWAEDPLGYRDEAIGYASLGQDGVAGWLYFVARTTTLGAERGMQLADAVLSGRPLTLE